MLDLGLVEKSILFGLKQDLPELFKKASCFELDYDNAYQKIKSSNIKNDTREKRRGVVNRHGAAEVTGVYISFAKFFLLNNSMPLSLHPASFPYDYQSDALAEATKLLEAACFDFTDSNEELKQLALKQCWNRPATLELSVWIEELKQIITEKQNLAGQDIQLGQQPEDFWRSIKDLRNDSVHKNRPSASRVAECLENGNKLAKLLNGE